ncbi:MAG TPA: hypothetical protein VIF09_24715 [Polyangiaceae bacterium]
MSKIRFGSFTLRTDCAHCGQPMPVNAPAQTTHCTYCQNDVALPGSIWWHLLGQFDEEHDALRDGRGAAKTVDMGGLTLHYEYTRGAPPPTVAATFDAPTWLRDLVTNVRQVYVTDAGAAPGSSSGAAVVPVAAAKPVVMTCPQCGGALHVTAESQRTITCKFCNVDVFLPDDLWRRLHPVKVVQPWWVRFEGKTRRQEKAAEDAAEQRRREAERQAGEKREEFLAKPDVERDVAVARARRHAMTTVAALYVMMIVTLATLVVALEGDVLGDAEAPVYVALVSLTVLASGVAVFLGGRTIKLRQGRGVDDKMPLFWMMLVIGFIAPIGGQIDHLAMGFVALFSGLGAKGGGDRKKNVTPSRRETLPLALVFFALTVWWPLAAWGLFKVLSTP